MPRILLLVIAFLFALPATAVASNIGGSPPWFQAGPGENNDVTVTFSGGRYTVRDSGAPLEIAPGCERIDAHTASCPGDPGTAVQAAHFSLGDGDDVLHADDGPDVIDGGAGNDELHGGGSADQIAGGPGNDLLDGGGGDPSHRNDPPLAGLYNPWPDVLDGGPGADVMQGGGGDFDKADYSSRTAPLSITLDGVANDGEAGEGDNVEPDIEDVTAGSGDDVLVGSPGPNDLRGGAGNDLIDGNGGYQDYAEGDDGNDVLKLFDGGIEGLRGIDGPIPGFKFDDLARCDGWTLGSSGDDTAFVDPTDAGQAGQLSKADPPCEHVFMSGSPQSLPIVGGTVALPVTCGAGRSGSCNGTAVVRLPKRVHGAAARTPRLGARIARRQFRGRFGHRKHVRAKLSRAGRRAVGRHRHVRVWVVYNFRR